MKPPASEHLRSEPWIVAELALASLGPDSGIDWRGLAGDYDRVRDLIARVFPDQFEDYNARIRIPGGFRLPVPTGERVWTTASGRAAFITYAPDDSGRDDPTGGDAEVLVLTTLRSHDQYNTTIYGMNDRYRGVKGRRDVVFANPADLAARGLSDGDLIDLERAEDDGIARILRGFTVVARDLPRGCLAAYYPEANPLVALSDRDKRSGTPAYKSIPVRLSRSS